MEKTSPATARFRNALVFADADMGKVLLDGVVPEKEEGWENGKKDSREDLKRKLKCLTRKRKTKHYNTHLSLPSSLPPFLPSSFLPYLNRTKS